MYAFTILCLFPTLYILLQITPPWPLPRWALIFSIFFKLNSNFSFSIFSCITPCISSYKSSFIAVFCIHALYIIFNPNYLITFSFYPNSNSVYENTHDPSGGGSPTPPHYAHPAHTHSPQPASPARHGLDAKKVHFSLTGTQRQEDRVCEARNEEVGRAGRCKTDLMFAFTSACVAPCSHHYHHHHQSLLPSPHQ